MYCTAGTIPSKLDGLKKLEVGGKISGVYPFRPDAWTDKREGWVVQQGDGGISNSVFEHDEWELRLVFTRKEKPYDGEIEPRSYFCLKDRPATGSGATRPVDSAQERVQVYGTIDMGEGEKSHVAYSDIDMNSHVKTEDWFRAVYRPATEEEIEGDLYD